MELRLAFQGKRAALLPAESFQLKPILVHLDHAVGRGVGIHHSLKSEEMDSGQLPVITFVVVAI